MDIEQMLKEYRSNKSKLKLLEISEKELLNQLCNENDIPYISAMKISDIPSEPIKKFNSIVENLIIKKEKIVKDNAKVLDRLRDLIKEEYECKIRIEKVEALLESLVPEEKFIIEKFYIDNLIWRHVTEEYKKNFGEYKTKDTLKRIKKKALKKMQKIKAA